MRCEICSLETTPRMHVKEYTFCRTHMFKYLELQQAYKKWFGKEPTVEEVVLQMKKV